MDQNFKLGHESKLRYREENGIACIDIFLKNMFQLFDRRDPSPFQERDLDEDFSKFLTLAMVELKDFKNVKMVIKMPEHIPTYLKAHDVEEAIYNFYSFEVETTENELSTLFRQGRWAFLMAFIFLSISYVGAFFLKTEFPGLITGALGEGLTVMGWVAMWRPINIFLYEWWPYRDKLKLYYRILKLKVEIVTG